MDVRQPTAGHIEPHRLRAGRDEEGVVGMVAAVLELQRIFLDNGGGRHMAADAGDLGGHGHARAFAARGAGAARQAQPVNLADHRIAGDPAQGPGDLAGRETLGPQSLELFDAVIRPICLRHGSRSWLPDGFSSSPPVTRYSSPALAPHKRYGGYARALST